MRHALLLAALLLIVLPASAQEAERETGFMMMNQHACPGDGFEGMMDVFETKTGPILNELRDEDMIQDWGLLTHAWGDEYNFNFYMIADNHRAWLDAWGQMVSRMNDRHEGWGEMVSNYCTFHKDNLYTHHRWE